MKIGNLTAKSPVFGRALCAREEEDMQHLIQDGLNELAIDNAIQMFSFSVPNGKYHKPMGTLFSEEGIKTAEFASIYWGANTLLIGPMGQVSTGNISVYDGTNFSIGLENLSPERLTTSDYENLLTKEDLAHSSYTNYYKDNDPNKKAKESTVGYRYMLFENNGENGIMPLFKTAYDRFQQLPTDSSLKQEFDAWKDSDGVKYWLHKDAVVRALNADYIKQGKKGIDNWSQEDRDIYKNNNERRIREIEGFEDEDGRNLVDFYEFTQFILYKQERQTKTELNNRFNDKKIEIKGDCPIGLSELDTVAFGDIIYDSGLRFGAKDGDKRSCYSLAPDFECLLNGSNPQKASKILEFYHQKFRNYFNRYNSLRVDSAWQLISPNVYRKVGIDNDGNMMGTPDGVMQPELGTKLFDIMLEEAENAHVAKDKISLEFLDGEGKSWRILGGNQRNNDSYIRDVINKNGIYCTFNTHPIKSDWGYPQFYRNSGQNYDTKMWNVPVEFSIGGHDHSSIREYAEDGSVVAALQNILKKQFWDTKDKVKGLFTLLYTNTPTRTSGSRGKVTIGINDAIGNTRRINTPNTAHTEDEIRRTENFDLKDGNWKFRLGKNWEEDYFNNLNQGYGFNAPEIISAALKTKNNGRESELTRKLDKYAEVLAQDGPMTRKQANLEAKNHQLNTVV